MKKRSGFTDMNAKHVTLMRGPISTKLLVERETQLDALGPRPPWWRLFARRRWQRRHAAIMTMDVSENTEMLRHWYGDEYLKRLAARPPMFGTTRKR